MERDDCRRWEGDAADFTIDSGLKFGCSRYMQRWKRRIGAGSSCIFFPPLPPAALSLYGCGSGQCHSKTKWVFRQQRLCSVSNIAKFPFQIPPKSQRYPARGRTYYSVAQLVNPANIQALLERPFHLPLLLVSLCSPSLLLLYHCASHCLF